MKNLELMGVQEMNAMEMNVVDGGYTMPMWLKVSLTIGGCGAAGFAVGYYC